MQAFFYIFFKNFKLCSERQSKHNPLVKPESKWEVSILLHEYTDEQVVQKLKCCQQHRNNCPPHSRYFSDELGGQIFAKLSNWCLLPG